mgnify:CR=1 FL=1
MGFSLTGSHVVFFIASVIAAAAVSGVLVAISYNLNESLSNRAARVQEVLDIDFTIINDNEHIPTSNGDYIFYLKNIGNTKIKTTPSLFQLFNDGELISSTNYSFSTSTLSIGDVGAITISTTISTGDHTLRIVGPQAISDEFYYRIP